MPDIAQVAVNITKKIDREIFHYRIPPHMRSSIKIGCRVQVPLGFQICEGFVIDFPQETKVKELKEIQEIIDTNPIISQEMVTLAIWVSEKYLCPLYRVLDYILPPYARIKKEKWVELTNTLGDMVDTLSILDPLADKILKELGKGPQRLETIVNKFSLKSQTVLEDLEKRGLVNFYYNFKNQGSAKYLTYIESQISKEHLEEIINQKLKRAPKQAEIIKYLTKQGPCNLTQLCRIFSINSSSLISLEKKGLVKKYKLREERLPEIYKEFENKKKLKFNDDQLKAITEISNQLHVGKFGTFLLHGVTGSGKTEVYLECIKNTLKLGRGAILLVPEISLTPQVIGRFKSILGEQVVVLHSNLSQGERLDVWEKLRSGKAKVLVGVRSAIFAPVQNLGLIVIDEEHETTFKQTEPDPRYHARDVALERSKITGAVLVLGSATPSLESYYRTQRGIYRLLEMPQRVTRRTLPQVEIVDLREEFKIGNKSIFSRKLQENIDRALARGEQVILFLNRRGYSTFVLCRECGKPLQCQNCSISLTFHSFPLEMKCHYCNYSSTVPKRCPSCGSTFIRYFGSGTQQVEMELKKIWPEIKVTRMDVDTTRNKNSHQKLLAEFRRGETNILLGTQMITKGLDFPNITLVGVIAADMSLNLPDYTSSERTFQLLTQVAGRAGRGEKEGKVIIQTYNPTHYSITSGKSQDYHEFYQQELAVRKLMDYPPFSSFIRILISDFKEKTVISCSEKIGQVMQTNFKNRLEILGPAQAPISKIKNRFRWQIILKGNDLEFLRNAARYGLKQVIKEETSKTLRVIIDVEPQSIL